WRYSAGPLTPSRSPSRRVVRASSPLWCTRLRASAITFLPVSRMQDDVIYENARVQTWRAKGEGRLDNEHIATLAARSDRQCVDQCADQRRILRRVLSWS